MNKKLAANLLTLTAVVVLFLAALGRPAVLSRKQLKKYDFPEGVTVHLVNTSEIEIPKALVNSDKPVHYEIFDDNLKNVKIEIQAAKIFLSYSGKLLETTEEKLVFAVKESIAKEGKNKFDFLSILKDGSLVLQTAKQFEKGVVPAAIHKFDPKVFSDHKLIKTLASKSYVKLSKDKKKLLVLDSRISITVVFYDTNGKPDPIAIKTLSADRVMISQSSAGTTAGASYSVGSVASSTTSTSTISPVSSSITQSGAASSQSTNTGAVSSSMPTATVTPVPTEVGSKLTKPNKYPYILAQQSSGDLPDAGIPVRRARDTVPIPQITSRNPALEGGLGWGYNYSTSNGSYASVQIGFDGSIINISVASRQAVYSTTSAGKKLITITDSGSGVVGFIHPLNPELGTQLWLKNAKLKYFYKYVSGSEQMAYTQDNGTIRYDLMNVNNTNTPNCSKVYIQNDYGTIYSTLAMTDSVQVNLNKFLQSRPAKTLLYSSCSPHTNTAPASFSGYTRTNYQTWDTASSSLVTRSYSLPADQNLMYVVQAANAVFKNSQSLNIGSKRYIAVYGDVGIYTGYYNQAPANFGLVLFENISPVQTQRQYFVGSAITAANFLVGQTMYRLDTNVAGNLIPTALYDLPLEQEVKQVAVNLISAAAGQASVSVQINSNQTLTLNGTLNAQNQLVVVNPYFTATITLNSGRSAIDSAVINLDSIKTLYVQNAAGTRILSQGLASYPKVTSMSTDSPAIEIQSTYIVDDPLHPVDLYPLLVAKATIAEMQAVVESNANRLVQYQKFHVNEWIEGNSVEVVRINTIDFEKSGTEFAVKKVTYDGSDGKYVFDFAMNVDAGRLWPTKGILYDSNGTLVKTYSEVGSYQTNFQTLVEPRPGEPKQMNFYSMPPPDGGCLGSNGVVITMLERIPEIYFSETTTLPTGEVILYTNRFYAMNPNYDLFCGLPPVVDE